MLNAFIMQLTYLIDSLKPGGKERQLSLLLKELSKGNEIQLIIFNEDVFYKDVLDLPIKIQIISKRDKYKGKTLLRIYQLLKSHKPELIHSWSNVVTLIALPYLIIHPKVKLISSIRYAGKLNKSLKGNVIKNLTWARSIAVVSNSKRGLEVENLLNHFKGAAIHNGMDLSHFDFVNKNEQENLSVLNKFKKKVVMVGRFYIAKDYLTYIKAAKLICQKQSNICFICIGDGPNKAPAEKEAGSLLNKNIFFLGNRNNIPSLLKSMDIGVLLNNTDGHAEGISNAIMEYMAAGLPVIATKAGGTPEIVQENVSGILVPAFKEKIVAEKILYLINNQNRAREMGKAGRKIVEKDFSISKMSDSYQQLYERLIHE